MRRRMSMIMSQQIRKVVEKILLPLLPLVIIIITLETVLQVRCEVRPAHVQWRM